MALKSSSKPYSRCQLSTGVASTLGSHEGYSAKHCVNSVVPSRRHSTVFAVVEPTQGLFHLDKTSALRRGLVKAWPSISDWGASSQMLSTPSWWREGLMFKPRRACEASSHPVTLGLKNCLFYILNSCSDVLCDALYISFCTELCWTEKYKISEVIQPPPMHPPYFLFLLTAFSSNAFKQTFSFSMRERKKKKAFASEVSFNSDFVIQLKF